MQTTLPSCQPQPKGCRPSSAWRRRGVQLWACSPAWTRQLSWSSPGRRSHSTAGSAARPSCAACPRRAAWACFSSLDTASSPHLATLSSACGPATASCASATAAWAVPTAAGCPCRSMQPAWSQPAALPASCGVCTSSTSLGGSAWRRRACGSPDRPGPSCGPAHRLEGAQTGAPGPCLAAARRALLERAGCQPGLPQAHCGHGALSALRHLAHNWVHGLRRALSAVGCCLQLDLEGMQRIDIGDLRSCLSAQLAAAWAGLAVSPRSCPSEGARLCTCLRGRACALICGGLLDLPLARLPCCGSRCPARRWSVFCELVWFLRFRTAVQPAGCHAASSVTGGWGGMSRSQRLCPLCESQCCDERHVLLECPALAHLQEKNQQLFGAHVFMRQFMWQADMLQLAWYVVACLRAIEGNRGGAAMNMLVVLLSGGPCGLAARPPAWRDARACQCPHTGPPLAGVGSGGDAAAAPGLRLGGLVSCRLAER